MPTQTSVTEGLVGFPPGRGFLLIPRAPRRAAAAALALYEAVEPRQRALLTVMRAATAAGATRFLSAAVPAALDAAWWEAWAESVAPTHVAQVSQFAFRVPPNGRTSALLLDVSGAPVGFVKLLAGPPTVLEGRIAQSLNRPQLPFQAPRVLAENSFRGRHFRLCTPLPEGPHRRPPVTPSRVQAIIDAWQSALSHVERPANTPTDHVVCHGDFTPRNLRVARDGSWWLIDWDNARWGPRLADELHYWCADRCWRRGHDVERDAAWVLARLRERGPDDEIAAAARWPDAPPRTYRAAEQELRRMVGEMSSGKRAQR